MIKKGHIKPLFKADPRSKDEVVSRIARYVEKKGIYPKPEEISVSIDIIYKYFNSWDEALRMAY